MLRFKGTRVVDAMITARRVTKHFSPLLRRAKAGSMVTATQSPAYKIIEDSAGVHKVSQKEGKFYIEVRTSGWAEIDGQIYSWDTVAKDIPVNRLSE